MKGSHREACFRALLRDRHGATAVEYGLILALVFLAVAVGVTTLGESVRARWDDIANRVSAT